MLMIAIPAPHPTSLIELVFMVLKAGLVIGLGAVAVGAIVLMLSWMFGSLKNFLTACLVLAVVIIAYAYWAKPLWFRHLMK